MTLATPWPINSWSTSSFCLVSTEIRDAQNAFVWLLFSECLHVYQVTFFEGSVHWIISSLHEYYDAPNQSELPKPIMPTFSLEVAVKETSMRSLKSLQKSQRRPKHEFHGLTEVETSYWCHKACSPATFNLTVTAGQFKFKVIPYQTHFYSRYIMETDPQWLTLCTKPCISLEKQVLESTLVTAFTTGARKCVIFEVCSEQTKLEKMRKWSWESAVFNDVFGLCVQCL